MEIKTNHMKISKDYSEFALAGELAIVVGVVAETRRQAEGQESLVVEKGKALGAP